MMTQTIPSIETVELFAPNTGNRRVIINGVLCYEWEFQGILYYPMVEFVPYYHNPCKEPIKEVYRLDGTRVGTLRWVNLDLDTVEYDYYLDDDDNEPASTTTIARQTTGLLNQNTNPEYIWNTLLPERFIIQNYYGHKYTYRLSNDKLIKFQYNNRRYNEHSRRDKFLLLRKFGEEVKHSGNISTDFEEEPELYILNSILPPSLNTGIFHVFEMEDEIPLYLEPAILLK
jgi:hypothetical protein